MVLNTLQASDYGFKFSQENNIQSSAASCVTKIPLSVLEKESKIFGKGSDKTVSHYQVEINNAALALCKEDASLLKNRNEVFNQAKLKIDQDGFRYKRRQSRSKVFGQGAVDDQQIQVTKRVKLSSEVRERRMKQKMPQTNLQLRRV